MNKTSGKTSNYNPAQSNDPQVRPGHPRSDPALQADIHRDAGRRRDEPGPLLLQQGLRQRPRRRAAVGRPGQGLRGRRLRSPPRPGRPHVRHTLRLHAVPHTQGSARVSPGSVSGARGVCSSGRNRCVF